MNELNLARFLPVDMYFCTLQDTHSVQNFSWIIGLNWLGYRGKKVTTSVLSCAGGAVMPNNLTIFQIILSYDFMQIILPQFFSRISYRTSVFSAATTILTSLFLILKFHSSLRIPHYSLLIALHCLLLIPHSMLLTSHFSLVISHSSLFIAHSSRNHFLFFTIYYLPFTYPYPL